MNPNIIAVDIDGGDWLVLDAGDNLPTALPFTGLMAIEPTMAFYLVELMQSLTAKDIIMLQARVDFPATGDKTLAGPGGGEDEKKPYKVYDGIAHIPMSGVMTKRPVGCMDRMMDGPSVSTIQVRSMLRQADRDDSVKSKLLVADSPGGEVSGAFDLANDVLHGRKPTDTFFEDMGASGAMLVGCGGRHVSANSNAALGSVGVYTTVTDRSVMNDRMGARVHVIKAGKYKAAGHPGVTLSDEDMAHIQARVDAQHGLFLQHITRGRPSLTKAQLADIADAGVYIGAQAKKIGLIDEITNLDGAHKQAMKSNDVGTRRVTMIKDAQLQAWLSGEPAPPDTDAPPATPGVVEVPRAWPEPPAPVLPSGGSGVTGPNTETVSALTILGINNVGDLRSLAEDALIGRAFISEQRTRAIALATSVMKNGTPAGDKALLSATTYLNSAPIDVVSAAIETYETQLRDSGMAAAPGQPAARRFTAPAQLGGHAADAEGVAVDAKTSAAAADDYANHTYGSHATTTKNGRA